MNRLIVLCIIAVTTSLALAETCQKPEVSASAYVTEDATVLTNIAFTTQFTLKCSNGAKGVSLYAEVEGKTLPAVRLSADNKYQVSWTEDIKKARSGDYNVNLYDEEGYSALRKAIRNGEDPSSVKPLAVVVLNNPGAYLGPWINSELLAAFLAAFVTYTAFSAKWKLLS
ncbi:translocon-associated protein subunit delta [Neodiprion pinetum]|uniref:Translocon-associated protein subunit delta n=1 Tax=Neodiprion lecontei TaxID=441921 RepID=A0A6J0C9P6_NEOLC|nr:translocon-associated protein subunit delta [Neodiprion lecontei]XP_046431559.1 translocon-associated protein subunit delta [Neodiprion fabricii]XP_046488656.1 translocon-associated protein subunit delta [Neodiprion pinetum]XP_046625740.1 translocon-associated protein subunit delta [Neodiprion virginianus]